MQAVDQRLELEDDDLEYLQEQIQQSFWVDFTEEEFAEAASVGDLFDKIVQKIGEFGSPRCLTSFAFYRLRRTLVEVAGLDRRSIGPSTRLRCLLPPTVRRDWWKTVETDLRLRLPSLRPGRAAVTAYCAIALLTVLAFVLPLTQSVALRQFIPGDAWFLMPAAYFLLVWVLGRVAGRLPHEFPAETFEDLVRLVVTMNHQKLAQEAGGSTIAQAWTTFRELISSVAGVAPASITREVFLRGHEKLR